MLSSEVADTTLSGISAGRAALGEAASTTAASFAELSTAFTLLPPDIARIVFPAASFKPLQPDADASSTTRTLTASVLECGSPHRTALAIRRVREHLCAILRARSVLYGDSMSLTQLATLAAAKEEYVCKLHLCSYAVAGRVLCRTLQLRLPIARITVWMWTHRQLLQQRQHQLPLQHLRQHLCQCLRCLNQSHSRLSQALVIARMTLADSCDCHRLCKAYAISSSRAVRIRLLSCCISSSARLLRYLLRQICAH